LSAQQINEDWFRKENSNGDIEQYDLVPSYDSFDEVKTFLVTEGFMEPLTEQGTGSYSFSLMANRLELSMRRKTRKAVKRHYQVMGRQFSGLTQKAIQSLV
jgi:hypothetical protein